MADVVKRIDSSPSSIEMFAALVAMTPPTFR